MRKVKKIIAVFSAMAVISSMSLTAFAASTSNEESEREKTNQQLSKEAATQGMVLLENNNNSLPLPESTEKIALFGGGAPETVKGGTGSGDVNQRYVVSVRQGLINDGYTITSDAWLDAYDAEYIANKPTGGGMMSRYSWPDTAIDDAQLIAAASADTAIYVIARISGEGSDRTNAKGDYLLTDVETANLTKLGANFDNVVVLLNVGGIVDTSFFDTIPGLDSLLLMSQPGMEAGNAVAEVLDGTVTPSGKLTDTWAENYSDYPSSVGFGANDGNTTTEYYTDGIYVGYRYFDTFGIEPKYEFGYGKSYTTFDTTIDSVTADANKVTVKATVANTGSKYSGKEVVQVYFSAPAGSLEKPYQELAAFAKTDILAPGKQQTLTITYDTTEMSSYSEADAAYIMEEGDYIIRVGNSSRNTHVGAVVNLDEDKITEQLSNQMGLKDALDEISNEDATPYTYDSEEKEINKASDIKLSADDIITENNASEYDDETVTTYAVEGTTEFGTSYTRQNYETMKIVDEQTGLTLTDVYNGTVSMKDFVAQMSTTELATIASGSSSSSATVPVVGSSSDSVKGAAGETTKSYIDKYGIPNTILADGPAGIRITQSFAGQDTEGTANTYYQYCTAWPIGTLLAMSWDEDLIEQVGDAIGTEMTEYGVTLWLAPGMNIHRNPLCGRNFEYYSEDPVQTGIIGAAITKGVQSNPGIGVTVKHFTTNNQEVNRSSENNIISERTLREIYMKGFQIVVQTAQPMAIMTCYNQFNDVYVAANYDVCTDVTRGEWGFKGLIMTDWGCRANKALSMHAGNDLIMPGGSSSVTTITNGVGTTISKGDLQKSVVNILNIIMQSTQMGSVNNVDIDSYSDQFDLSDYVNTVKSAISVVDNSDGDDDDNDDNDSDNDDDDDDDDDSGSILSGSSGNTNLSVSNSSSWTSVATKIKNVTAGSTVTITMTGVTTVPSSIFSSIKGRNVDVVLKIGNFTWTINGKDVTSAKDIDLAVVLSTANPISSTLVAALAGTRASTQMQLSYDGELGFTGTLTVNLSKSNAGKYANLYYYNPTTNQLEYKTNGVIDSDGNVDLDLNHASDYVIVLDDKAMTDELSAGAPITDESSPITANANSEKAFPYIAVVVVLTAGMILFKQKNIKNQK